ncbi:ATP-dependent zinc metallopeptidase, putative [Bodo saltans]|uniref:ATP-dependent zinc metallopeptidase, putative n=1 Tax=Bodo saltans TaxID=75058 RepID=A0A0S4J3N2_BODSA|nr:ATP-dependent zinc metallopeptidase, putative [Bodo saltans]|eukprot:CUG86027.1 ATP-dependent zinc metallopeptidase, putative [Bodo saltans]
MYQQQAGYPQQPSQFGYPHQPQFGGVPPPQQQLYSQPPPQQYYAPPPPPPPMYIPAVAAVSQQDEDYYKGFHDGVVRNSGARLGSAISWVAPLAINIAFFVGPIWYIRRKYAQSMASAATAATGKDGKKAAGTGSWMEMMMPMKPKHYRVDVKGTKFNDVIGIPEAKEDLKQYVDFLKDPKKFTRLGARLPKGCLLTGQPGTGKTLLARAVAGEADTAFFACSGADFIEIFGGSGPKRVRELFAEARAAAPCVVFIDEIDAIGSRNSGRQMGGGGSSEENRTINQLLAELDGLSSKEAIVVVAATNYPEAIDKALLREGRFDRKVNIPMPDKSARTELFEFYLNSIVTGDVNCKPKFTVMKQRKPEGDDGKTTTATETPPPPPPPVVIIPGVSNKTYAEALAERTPGVSPAQIATVVNEAALSAAVKDEKVVTLPFLQEAIDDVLIGKKHRQRMSDASLHRTAYHECGHAIMAWLSPLQKEVIKVSIIPRGRAGGYTQQVQDEAMEPHTDQFLFSQLCVLLGGRVAERLILGDISTGALDDLQRATKIAMDKLLTYGMSKEIGQLAFKQNDRNDGRAWMNYSEDLHARVEAEARELVNKAYRHTLKTLMDNQKQLDDMGRLLLEKKEIMKDDITAIMGPKVSSP